MGLEEKNNLKHTTEMDKPKTFKDIAKIFLKKDSSGTLITKGGQTTPDYTSIPINKPKRK